jgi:hypothetical protein
MKNSEVYRESMDNGICMANLINGNSNNNYDKMSC